MKVLHIINSLTFGGAEKLLVDSLPLYKSEGIDTSILLLDETKTEFLDSLEKNGITILKSNNNKNMYNPIHIVRIAQNLKHFDIVHVHLFPALYWSAMSSFIVKSKTKLVYTEHSTENRRRKSTFFRIIDKLIYNRFSKIIAISEATKINLDKHLGNKFNNIIVINNGIILNNFKSALPYKKSEFNLNNSCKIIIQVSNFTAAKDQITLIYAFEKLPDNNHLFLVGEGPLKDICINLVYQLKIVDRVHFLGHRSDVPELLKTANISVLSSHYEGFGLSIVEGMASGNACVASNVPGVSEIIKNYGILFTVGNVLELKENLLRLIEDKTFNRNISEKCLKRSDEYDINLMIKKYIKVYKEIHNNN